MKLRSVVYFLVQTALICLLGALSPALAAPAQGDSQHADLILHNGKILTVDQNFSTAQAVAITGNKITAVGANQDVRPVVLLRPQSGYEKPCRI